MLTFRAIIEGEDGSEGSQAHDFVLTPGRPTVCWSPPGFSSHREGDSCNDLSILVAPASLPAWQIIHNKKHWRR